MTETSTLEGPAAAVFKHARPRRVRTFREFAEAEIRLPRKSPLGEEFRVDAVAWSGIILKEFDRGFYRRFFGSGSVQSGKTLHFLVIPLQYHLFEEEVNVIVGVPKIDMAQGIYEERILPSIQRGRYHDLLPKRGSGSRGGKFIAVQFENGAIMRFMGAGGSDAQRSSFTAPVVVLTEIDTMDQPGQVSRQADPVTQLEARTEAYGDRGRIYGECVMTTKTGRIYQEITEFGTDHRIYLPCPHCGTYVVPERANLVGWRDADTFAEARQNAGYACQTCGVLWTEKDRAKALRRPVAAGKDQTVDKRGRVRGELPNTDTFGIRWNQMHTPLVTMAGIAGKEFRAERAMLPGLKKALAQFTWAEPYEEELLDQSRIDVEHVTRKITGHPRGVVPRDTRCVSAFIDVGLYTCWYTVWAWTSTAEGYCIDYGPLQVPQGNKADPLAIQSTLRAFREDHLVPGWRVGEEEATMVHHLCLVDSRYQADIAYQFVLESGERYLASIGHGSGRNQPNWRAPKQTKDRQVGNEWFITRQPFERGAVRVAHLHSDHWKRQGHQGFAAPPGTAGSLHLYNAEPREHRRFAKQIVAERERVEYIPGRGEVTKWVDVQKDNHYLDCTAGCYAAAAMLGVRLEGPPPEGEPEQSEAYKPAKKGGGWKIGR